MKIATHDSSFHTDDTFAVASLLILHPEAEVVRSRNPEVHSTADYVVDTGMKYDPEKNLFDHHMPEGAGVRENGIPYASFGLVWKEFGRELAGGQREAEIIEERLVQPIDAHDNGVAIAEYKFEGIREYGIGDFLHSYLEGDTHDQEVLYKTFMHNVNMARELLEREIRSAKKTAEGEKKVRDLYAKSPDKRIIELPDGSLPWKSALAEEPEILYAIYPRPDGDWGLGVMPDFTKPYGNQKKPLPMEWAGREKEELQKITGVPGAKFVHRARFMASAATKKDAMALAKKALEA